MAKLYHLEEIEPIKHVGARVTIPLSYADGDEFPWPVASGTIVEHENRLVILTAAHIFDDCDINRFWLPSDRIGGRPKPLGHAKLLRPTDSDLFDIAVIAPLDEELTSSLRSSWGRVPSSQIGPASMDGTFILFGYPSEKLHAVDRTLVCSLITAFTDRLHEPPEDANAPLDSQVDIFFKFDEQARDETGVSVISPRLRGASGGGVWEISEAVPGTLWTAEKNMRLVGIQSSAMHGEWFRAKAAEIALSAFDDAIS